MRISKAGLLIVLALLAPLLVELRTVLSWINVELGVLETAVIGALIVGVILVWAFLPENGDDESSETDVSKSGP
ncbi:CbaC protein [Natronorubrum sp. JWXQ-INN-674]|uniref:CbaC protein n=1 Tax=Natronorubrum halalkaliphilum TaxID=2691917 RepID=A0A6B0VLK0_9EURY|nr:CbaC protein [Natronorubrum halalkaliphilum]MXV62450.1 CbaC protein [Natronorubrum halalkaliphilum]